MMEGKMTTVEILEALTRECPNGVSFDPMSVRLLVQKIPFDERKIEDLKAAMFQLGRGLCFSREMILNDESLLAFEGQAKGWLNTRGCFSVARLFEDFCSVLRNIATPEACAAFLQYLGFTVADWEKGGLFCYMLPSKLDDILGGVAETIIDWIEENGGTLTFNEIEQAMPHLSIEALESIRVNFLPEIYRVEVGGVPCWRSADSIALPEDFSEKLTVIIDTLVTLEENVTPTKLEFALNLFYQIRFRKEYALLDSDIFMCVCAKHYLGGSNLFSNSRAHRVRTNKLYDQGTRVRSPNTRFSSLGVPIGSILIFTKDNHVTCTVWDESNQVFFDGKIWAISTLAKHLLKVSSVNGFCYFIYENEILWERRLRLEKNKNNG
jgi:hypothetical protein